jgi:hypothetical protein
MSKVLKEFKSSTGGTVQVFAWGIRHTAGKAYSGAGATEVPDGVAKKPRKGPGRPRNS